MKSFKHFTSAHDNYDLTKVRMIYGTDGHATYWCYLEVISGDLGSKRFIRLEIPTLVYCTCLIAKNCDRNSGPMGFDSLLDCKLANPLARVTK